MDPHSLVCYNLETCFLALLFFNHFPHWHDCPPLLSIHCSCLLWHLPSLVGCWHKPNPKPDWLSLQSSYSLELVACSTQAAKGGWEGPKRKSQSTLLINNNVGDQQKECAFVVGLWRPPAWSSTWCSAARGLLRACAVCLHVEAQREFVGPSAVTEGSTDRDLPFIFDLRTDKPILQFLVESKYTNRSSSHQQRISELWLRIRCC